jgi:hypothetical protein
LALWGSYAGGLDLQCEIHDAGDDHACGRAEAQAGSLVDPLAIQGGVDREAQAPVVPGRLRIPLLSELDPEDRRVPRGNDLHARVALDVLGLGAIEHYTTAGRALSSSAGHDSRQRDRYGVPEATTRAVMLKSGEADISCTLFMTSRLTLGTRRQ